MRHDCPNCWSNNVLRIENQKSAAYCEDCGCFYDMLTGEEYEKC
jgi:transcription initiation factor TFIIIB Brf1 subunit/transcription initiation factor TFIIB